MTFKLNASARITQAKNIQAATPTALAPIQAWIEKNFGKMKSQGTIDTDRIVVWKGKGQDSIMLREPNKPRDPLRGAFHLENSYGVFLSASGTSAKAFIKSLKAAFEVERQKTLEGEDEAEAQEKHKKLEQLLAQLKG